MADQPVRRQGGICRPQCGDDRRQLRILAVVVRDMVSAFQFDADTEIVAAFAASEI